MPWACGEYSSGHPEMFVEEGGHPLRKLVWTCPLPPEKLCYGAGRRCPPGRSPSKPLDHRGHSDKIMRPTTTVSALSGNFPLSLSRSHKPTTEGPYSQPRIHVGT